MTSMLTDSTVSVCVILAAHSEQNGWRAVTLVSKDIVASCIRSLPARPANHLKRRECQEEACALPETLSRHALH